VGGSYHGNGCGRENSRRRSFSPTATVLHATRVVASGEENVLYYTKCSTAAAARIGVAVTHQCGVAAASQSLVIRLIVDVFENAFL